jgi:hypothetical protein
MAVDTICLDLAQPWLRSLADTMRQNGIKGRVHAGISPHLGRGRGGQAFMYGRQIFYCCSLFTSASRALLRALRS